MKRSLELGLDMSGWEEPRIQQIVDVVNAPMEFLYVPEPQAFVKTYWSTSFNWWPR